MPPSDPVPSGGDSLELDLLASSLRADSSDVRAFVESLAVKLEEAIPGLVRVQRARSGLRGPKLVRTIAVDAGGDRLELTCEAGDRVQARRAHVSGGITLKTEAIDVDEWMQALTQALGREAGRSEQIRQSLERLLLQ